MKQKKNEMMGQIRRLMMCLTLCLMLSVAGDLVIPGLPSYGVVTVHAAAFKNRVPKLVSATATSNKITVKWEAVKDATAYYVYRKNADLDYELIGKSSSLSYKDETARPGINYTYTVCGIKTASGNKVTTTAYNETGVMAMINIPVVEINSVAMSSGKVNLKWTAIAGVDGYIIYRKEDDGSYKTAKTITKGKTASWKDGNVFPGISYTYTVRAYVNDDDIVRKGPYYSDGLTILVPPEIPEMKSVVSFSGRTLVEWEPSADATGYYVYRKQGDGSYSKLSTVSGQEYYRDAGVKAGKTYSYAVRAFINKNGKTAKSKYQEISVVVKPEAAQLTDLSTNSKKTKDTISWTAVPDVAGYNVYKKNKDTSNKWSLVKSVESTVRACSITRYANGPTSYAVRPFVKVDGKKLLSSEYDELSNTVDTYPRNYILFEGDSITHGYTWGGETAEVSYPGRVEQLVGCTVENRAVTNATLALRSETNHNSLWYRLVGAYGETYRPGSWLDEPSTEESHYPTYPTWRPQESSTNTPGDGGDPDELMPERMAEASGEDILEDVCEAEILEAEEELPAETSLEEFFVEEELDASYEPVEGDSFDQEGFLYDYDYYNVICMAAGTNDWNYKLPLGDIDDFCSNTFYGAWNQIFDRLLFLSEYQPKLKVVLITPIFRGRYQSDYSKVGMDIPNANGHTLQDYANAIYRIRDRYQDKLDIYVYDSVKANIINRSNYRTTLCDALHPTRETYVKMGKSIADYLKANVLED